MRRIAIEAPRFIPPFNEPARQITLQSRPLWLHQRELFAPYIDSEIEYPDWDIALKYESLNQVETIVHRDNIYFNAELLAEFVARAKSVDRPVQLAFSADDPSIVNHVLPLSTQLKRVGNLFLAQMWYLPEGLHQLNEAEPLVIDTEPRERGYYHIPPYSASTAGDLVYQLPKKAFVIIESWVHIFIADILFGIFTYAVNIEDEINLDWKLKTSILWRALVEQKPFLSTSSLVKIGKNSSIHPTAQITGPAIIGDDVTIGAGVVIDACIIGDNVNISQGAQLHISVIGNGCFLPFRASLFMTTVMERTMIAQNTCLQLCVIGRDSFIGAGSTFTDTSVLSTPIRALNGNDELEEVPLRVIGGCVGHHCHLGSGIVIYPARIIESDVILIPSENQHFIKKNVMFEDSSHHQLESHSKHRQLYPRQEKLVL
ncbi:MAG: carbonic anhydrase/acetyltransferase-like protein (isoleucine patch superfamily) [Cellvibrionaceae bacterium]|jgi:carbonic anhydrase/acetyltransferase-like protein (isoleucine patch superfamily)